MSKKSQVQMVIDSLNARINTLTTLRNELTATVSETKPRKPRVVKQPAAVKQGA
jgi:hypothetical protein